MPAEYPEIYEIIEEAIAERLQEQGIPRPAACQAAGAAAERVRSELGGQQVYFSKASAWDASERHKEIVALFKGGNYAELAYRFKLSERRIRQILDEHNRENPDPSQMNLFTREAR